MDKLFKEIGKIKVIPVITITDAELVIPLAEALMQGGLLCAEITFRTDVAEDCLVSLTKNFPEVLVGAGTVLNVEKAERAVKAGAKFIVSPGFNPTIVRWCLEHAVLVIPGVVTPSEIMQALEFNLEVLKFFPAESAGGAVTLKSLAGPFNEVQFIPTGGINLQNLRQYLSLPNVLAVGGSWFVKKEMIISGQFNEITRLTKEALSIAQQV